MDKRFECTQVGADFFETARYRFVAEEVIAATPAQIFVAFEDAHAWTVWAPPIQKVEWTSPKPYGLGTTRTVSMMGGLTGWESFIAWEPGRRMAFCFTHASQDNIVSFAEDYQVEDLGNGTCRVRWTMAMAPKGASAVFMPLTQFAMAWGVRWMFRRFRKLVEAEFAKSAAAV